MAPGMMTVTNNRNISHWSLEYGYENGLTERGYPIRMFNARKGGALVLVLNLRQDDLDYSCRGPVQGFKIHLTTPGEALKMSRHSFRIPPSLNADISIKPSLIVTSEELRRYKPEQRQCYFGSERPLRFYRTYAQHNCELECLANFTQMECGCVKFSMPSKWNNEKMGPKSWIKLFITLRRREKLSDLWRSKCSML